MTYPSPHPPPVFGFPPPPPPPPRNDIGPRNPLAVGAIAIGIALSILLVIVGAAYVFSGTKTSETRKFRSVASQIGPPPTTAFRTSTTNNPRIPTPADPPQTDDKTLEALSLACWSNPLGGCDDLGKVADSRGSESMALYARTCGGRIPDPGPNPPLTCDEIFR